MDSPRNTHHSIHDELEDAAGDSGNIIYLAASRGCSVEQASIQAEVEEYFFIELPKEYQMFLGAVGKFVRAPYGLVQASIIYISDGDGNYEDIGFQQSTADPCVLGQTNEKGELEIMFVIFMDGTLVASKIQQLWNASTGNCPKVHKRGFRRCMRCHIDLYGVVAERGV